MKLLTLNIRGAKNHIINFKPESSQCAQYLIDQINEDIPVVRFYLKNENINEGVVFQLSNGENTAYVNSITSSFTRGENEDFVYVDILMALSLSPQAASQGESESESENPDEEKIAECVEMRNNGGVYYTPTNENCNLPHIINIKVEYHGNKFDSTVKPLVNEFKLVAVPRKNIADVVLDFGSEASQILSVKRDNSARLDNITPLFDRIKRSYMPNDTTADSNFVQFTAPANYGLYLSKFLIPKEITSKELRVNPSVAPPINGMLKFLVKKNDLEVLKSDHINLPNIKIMKFGGYNTPNILVNNIPERISMLNDNSSNPFYRCALNLFLHQAIKEIEFRNSLSKPSERIHFISFLVLMPNVYSHRDISSNLNYIKSDIQEMIDGQYNFLKGFEVSAVSESDASLLGALEINTNTTIKSGNYLIMDAGKGTLDFSIMKYNANAEHNTPCYQNLSRSGIIGAGNSISYGILLSVIRSMISGTGSNRVEESCMQELIHGKILGLSDEGMKAGGGDPKHILDLVAALDKYKCLMTREMYKTYVESSEESPLVDDEDGIELEDITIESITRYINDMIKNEFFAPDYHHHIKNMIDGIVNLLFITIEEARKGQIMVDSYVFAGRGFLFEPLKDAVEAQLKSIFPQCKEVSYIGHNNSNSKNVCMYITNTIKNGDYNTFNIGKPFLIETKDEQTKSDKRFSFLPEFKDIFNFKKTANELYGIMKMDATAFHDPVDSSDNPLVYGYKFLDTRDSQKINLGGITYNLSRECRNNKIELFYDGEEYHTRYEIRDANGDIRCETKKFDPKPNMEGQFIFESIFPYCEGELNEIVVNHTPKLTKREQPEVETEREE